MSALARPAKEGVSLRPTLAPMGLLLLLRAAVCLWCPNSPLTPDLFVLPLALWPSLPCVAWPALCHTTAPLLLVPPPPHPGVVQGGEQVVVARVLNTLLLLGVSRAHPSVDDTTSFLHLADDGSTGGAATLFKAWLTGALVARAGLRPGFRG